MSTTVSEDPTSAPPPEETPQPEPEPQPPTTTPDEPSTEPPSSPPSTEPSSTTTSEPPSTTLTTVPSTTTSSSTSSEPESTTESTTTSTTSSTPTTSSEEETSTTETSTTQTSTLTTVTSTEDGTTRTTVVIITSTRTQPVDPPEDTTSGNPTEEPTPIDPSSGGGGGSLSDGGKVAIGVVVPIVAIAVIAIVGLFFWKKRKAKQAAAEERRKEVEDYSYNPNASPTFPGAGLMGTESGYEMREDVSSGYRGWGTTLAGSTGRKASTTMSGGGIPYSDAASPTQANATLARDDEAHSPEGEILGAMGPSAGNNRGTGVNRGPSNASSSYSAAGRSDGSDGAVGLGYGGGGNYYDQQGHHPYSDNAYGTQEMPAPPVIRDNPARRNTRIENPAHYPQQSAGISQNF